jgi:chromosome partitioning protein
MRVISIVGKKGGVGKTTSTVHIASRFADLGFKTCIIDFDTTQANATLSTIGPIWKEEGSPPGICQVIINGDPIESVIRETTRKNLYIVPSEKENKKGMPYNVEVALSQMDGGGYHVLKECLSESKMHEMFDILLIDNAPSLGVMTINSLNASDYSLTPIQANDLSISSIEDTVRICKKIESLNPYLKNLGVFVSLMDKRPKDSFRAIELAQSIANEEGVYFFDTFIPVSSKFNYLASKQKTIFDITKPSDRGHKEYIMLVEEVVRRIKEIDAQEDASTQETRA